MKTIVSSGIVTPEIVKQMVVIVMVVQSIADMVGTITKLLLPFGAPASTAIFKSSRPHSVSSPFIRTTISRWP